MLVTGAFNGQISHIFATYRQLYRQTSWNIDEARVYWKKIYSFLINNPEVVKVKIALDNGETIEEIIGKDTIPYVFYVDTIPTEYVFLDTEGNEID